MVFYPDNRGKIHMDTLFGETMIELLKALIIAIPVFIFFKFLMGCSLRTYLRTIVLTGSASIVLIFSASTSFSLCDEAIRRLPSAYKMLAVEKNRMPDSQLTNELQNKVRKLEADAICGL